MLQFSFSNFMFRKPCLMFLKIHLFCLGHSSLRVQMSQYLVKYLMFGKLQNSVFDPCSCFGLSPIIIALRKKTVRHLQSNSCFSYYNYISFIGISSVYIKYLIIINKVTHLFRITFQCGSSEEDKLLRQKRFCQHHH